MRITMRIYKRYDPDLLALYCASVTESDVKEEIKTILNEYISDGKAKKRQLPHFECPCMESLPPKVNFHINLDAKKDKKIINWLSCIRKGRRNNLIKEIIRSAYPPVISAYYPESDQASFYIDERRKAHELRQESPVCGEDRASGSESA